MVVTCTRRKSSTPSPKLSLRSVSGKTIEKRATSWIRRLEDVPVTPVEARSLYAGDHWSIVRTYEGMAPSNRFKIHVWVLSAGYGLVSIETLLKPYGATFSPSNEDAVCRYLDDNKISKVASNAEWWHQLAQWDGPKKHSPRTLQALAERSRGSPMIVVASPTYLRACQEDLTGACRRLNDSSQLMIVSAGAESLGELTPHLLPCDARLQKALGPAAFG